ncbi:PREDICTED: C-type lectin domain family 2 member E-like, partial [Tauraco erythrolophus]|uniref:C-type lectin domain family 2 member E-like n=1 Tax=Tauraco erythrolophus TaxID=121530 RepID=UPI000523D0EE
SRVLDPDFSEVCPDAWLGFQGKCYYFSEAEGNWTSSQESCKALGATLAFISSWEELDFIQSFTGKADHWLGLEKKDDGWGISSSLCHTRKNWVCSKPDSYILWRKKAYPSKNSL